jgi:uncharacterized membrane protein YqiK
MAKKADAWKEYKEAAMLDMILESLPKVAAEVAAPLSQAKKITMIADGSGEIGASKLTAEVLAIIASVPQAVKNMTGVDITATLARGGLGGSRVSKYFLNHFFKIIGKVKSHKTFCPDISTFVFRLQ